MSLRINQICLTVALYAFAFICNPVLAQNTMLMGKISDVHNQPVKGASLYLRELQDKPVAVSDDEGLFTSTMLPIGDYKVRIEANGKELQADNIQLSGKKEYFYFTLTGKKKVTTTISDDSPYMKARLSMIKANDQWFDAPVSRHNLRTPSEPYLWRVNNFSPSVIVIDTAFKFQKIDPRK